MLAISVHRRCGKSLPIRLHLLWEVGSLKSTPGIDHRKMVSSVPLAKKGKMQSNYHFAMIFVGQFQFNTNALIMS